MSGAVGAAGEITAPTEITAPKGATTATSAAKGATTGARRKTSRNASSGTEIEEPIENGAKDRKATSIPASEVTVAISRSDPTNRTEATNPKKTIASDAPLHSNPEANSLKSSPKS